MQQQLDKMESTVKEWCVMHNPALKLRLEKFSNSVTSRNDNAPTVASVQLADVAKQFTAGSLFWEVR